MKVFNNLNDLAKFVNSPQGLEVAMSEQSLKAALKREARRLEGYLKDELQTYFNSYSPSVYKRSGDMLNSIYVTDPIRQGIGIWSIEIRFKDSLANHPSVMGQEDGYIPWLLEVGWDIRDKVGYSAPMFTHHAGTGYIKKAVSKFNKSNPHGFIINVYRGNEEYI